MATVLVVDDDPISREFLRTLLGYRGHRTCEAADGDSALALAGRQPPDAVITDVLMPGLDGYELARMLRSRPTTSHIPIAFSTAHYGQQEIGPLARACGVQDVIFKPAQPTDVLATIDALLTADRIRRPASAGRAAEQPGIDARLRRAGTVALGEGRLHAIAATAPVGVLLADGAGRAYFVNSRLVQILGRPESDLLGPGWLDHIEPAGRERLVAAVATGAIRDGRPHRVARTPTGPEPRWLEICLYPVDETGPGDILGIVEDLAVIAQSHQRSPTHEWASSHLRRQAAYLADRLTETHHLTRSGTWDLDLETETVVLSPELRDLLRLPSATMPREQLRERVHPEDLARITAIARDTPQHTTDVAELRITDVDGMVHELMVSYRMATPERRSRPTLWGVAQDVTQFRQAQRAGRGARAAWQAERRVVDSFHRATLPAALPRVAGVDLGASYLTAPDRLDIGAGWYDAAPVPDGGVLLSVGRVAGHDQPAAVVGPVRAVLRAYGVDDPDPIRILARLNWYLTDTYDDDTFVTAVVARYEPDTGRLRVANAGHCAPLVISPGDEGTEATPWPPGGPALGIHPDAEFAGRQIIMPLGAALCAYTAVLTDHPGDPPTDVERLPLVATQAYDQVAGEARPGRPAAQRLAELIVDDMLDGTAPDDDICVAVLWTVGEEA